jgi:hypothetical protein
MGIEDEKEINRFIAQNEYEVNHRILEFVNQSKLLIANFAPSNGETLDYYVNGEVLIIMKPNTKELKTLYYITLDSENNKNSEKIKQYVKTIRKNNNKVKELKIIQKKQNKITDHYEFMIKFLDGEIDAKLKDKIETEKQSSINICKDLAAQENSIRAENKELMSQMFVKL